MNPQKETIYVYCENISDWYKWLKENHIKEKSVALIINKKHTGKGTVSHLDSMKEAIRFGWIDTTVKRLDDNRYIRNFRRRTDKSTWSKNTLSYAKNLLEQNRLYPEGLKRYNEGLKKPLIDEGIPNNPKTPSYVIEELKKQNLNREFKNVSKSFKKMHLRHILKAKSMETRLKRINELISLLNKLNKLSSTNRKKQT